MKIGNFECELLEDYSKGPYCKDALDCMLIETQKHPNVIYTYFGKIGTDPFIYPEAGNVQGADWKDNCFLNYSINACKRKGCPYIVNDELHAFHYTGDERVQVSGDYDFSLLVVANAGNLYKGIV